MNAPIRLGRRQSREGMRGRNRQRNRHIVAVLDEPAAGAAAGDRPVSGEFFRVREPLRISERHLAPAPAINADRWPFREPQHRFVERHLLRAGRAGRDIPTREFVEQKFRAVVHRVTMGISRGDVQVDLRPAGPYARIPMAKPALGKGLGALINTRVAAPVPAEADGERIQSIRLADIVPSPLQPRTEFRADQLNELVESIRERGIVQPLIVRQVGKQFELIAGERRWRASQIVGLTEAPAIIRKASDQEVLELALIENLQREDLNPIEEASAYQRLSQEFGLTQEEISRRVGKSRASVANAMRLLDLDPEVQSMVRQSRISVGHAKVLLSLKSKEEQRLLADIIIRQAASVRTAEKLAATQLSKTAGATGKKRGKEPGALAPAVLHLQNLLQHRLATRVVIQHGEKQGSITIEYYGNDDLHRILDELGVRAD